MLFTAFHNFTSTVELVSAVLCFSCQLSQESSCSSNKEEMIYLNHTQLSNNSEWMRDQNSLVTWVFFLGGYISGNEPPKLIQEAILHLCYELKNDAVALVDAIAPTDFILNSPIGKSDGQVFIVMIYTCT